MLTKDDFEYLLGKQEQLDLNIRGTKGITNDEWLSPEFELKHAIALKVEIGEFVNEIKDKEIWKYWNSKYTNLDKLIDEAIDVIHFALLVLNKKDGNIAKVMEMDITVAKDMFKDKPMEELIYKMINNGLLADVLACLFLILERFNFTREDVLDQYHTKNRENFRRLESKY